jgi:hypothetical protein
MVLEMEWTLLCTLRNNSIFPVVLIHSRIFRLPQFRNISTVELYWIRHLTPGPSRHWWVSYHYPYPEFGRITAQAVSSWIPTASARVRGRVRSWGICGRQSGSGVGFLRVLRFPLPIFSLITPYSSSSKIRGWKNSPNSGRHTNWTQSHPTQ